MPPHPAPTPAVALSALRERWGAAKPAERANAQSYLRELCEALGVPTPLPAGSGYEFELPVKLVTRDGTEVQGFVDLYKREHFVLEAKDADGPASDLALRKAYGQARQYAMHDPTGSAPPYLLVLDVAKTLIIWHRWGGTYQGFAAGHRIDLPTLEQHPADIELLRDIWIAPAKRDPRLHAQAVTKEIAGKLAELAASLEGRGLDQERVARFLMRVVFSCFAEDVDLLPREAFRQTVQRAGVEGDPAKFQRALEGLWRAMDEGGMYGFESLLRFNGHFFKDAEALPLDKVDILLLLEAARADWKDVEPTIFGTLLTRALDPEERHRLGAEYTPREFIERLVRPTVEEPVRERWTAVQAEVLQLRDSGKVKDRAAAEQRLREFLAWMQGLRVLDPACGSGNFLYVTMHMLKEVEHEAMRELEALTGHPELRMQEIGPANFLGLEVKPWAREIAELTLWIGFHQYWKRHHAVQPPEPVLNDTGTLECRDAVLGWTGTRRDESRDRPDPTPRLPHPVTAELVPDPSAVIPYTAYEGVFVPEWPAADFIIGNPPYLGSKRMVGAFGEGYVDALRRAYPEVPDAADYVMYWWMRAARAVESGRTLRAGLITTSSITQSQNRAVVATAAELGARVMWAIPDHVWFDGADDAAVRVAMTVIAKDPPVARLVQVEKMLRARSEVRVNSEVRVPMLNHDLTAHADVAGATGRPLRANGGLMSFGFLLNGAGFILERPEAEALLAADPAHAAIVRRYRNGRDLAQGARDVFVIDFGLRSEEEARAFPVLYDVVRTRVKPDRDATRDKPARERWWQFARVRGDLREALRGLPRYIATVETARHRFFTFLPSDIAPDHMVVVLPSDDAFHLGVLSSSLHVTWALAAGGRMGVGDTPRYNKGPCFEAFPFPDTTAAQRQRIAKLAEDIDAHRSGAQARDPKATMTAMYSVVEKLRSGEPLTAAERYVHDAAACGVLRDLLDQLDAAVADAYGWSWPVPAPLILERLVALHDRRFEEEATGHVRWLRPQFQRPRFATEADREAPAPTLALGIQTKVVASAMEPAAWPSDAVGQITVLRSMASVTPLSIEDAVRRLVGAKKEIVHRHLETLAMLGEVRDVGGGRYAVTSASF